MNRFLSPWMLLLVTWITTKRSNAFSIIAPFSLQKRRYARSILLSEKSSPLDIGVYSQVGADPNRPQKVNQDANFWASYFDCRYTCVGVLDGHGLKGHIVSEFLAQQLPRHFQQHLQDLLEESLLESDTAVNDTAEEEEEVSFLEFEEKLKELSGLSPEELNYGQHQPLLHQAVIRAFHSVHWAAMQNPDVPAGRNGATCVMVVLDHNDNTLHVAHVGDSRVVQMDLDSEGKITATPLSVETTVKIDAEKERVASGEGTIRGTNVFYGPVGIAMTRSLGNAVMLKAGVVPTPLVESFPGLDEQSYLVLATDGIWDVLTNEAVAALVSASHNNNDSTQKLCEAIAAEARRKWVGDLPIMDEEKVDDITCMVVRVKGGT